MSDQLYPGNLPGLQWDRTRSPIFKTDPYESVSGAERRFRHRRYPKYNITLQYEFLRQFWQHTELETLLGFFMEHGGAFESFLFQDPYDYVARNLLFGVGDGEQTEFQLVRRVGNFVEPVHNPSADSRPFRVWFPIGGNDSPFWPEKMGWPIEDEFTPEDGEWELLPNGVVRFPTAPPAGQVLIWSGTYYFRTRFSDDEFEYVEFLHRFFSTRQVQLVASLQNIL